MKAIPHQGLLLRFFDVGEDGFAETFKVGSLDFIFWLLQQPYAGSAPHHGHEEQAPLGQKLNSKCLNDLALVQYAANEGADTVHGLGSSATCRADDSMLHHNAMQCMGTGLNYDL